MKKRELFKIMAKSSRDRLINLASKIEENEEVEVIKSPEKTLVMVKMKDPVSENPYYLGEVLACEAIVKINGEKGMAVTMGDDFQKVYSMALIDGALNNKLDEKYEILKELLALESKIIEEERAEYSRIMKSKVDFSVMEE